MAYNILGDAMQGFVGVLDSGIGGLTVLQKLLPQVKSKFVYLADNAFCPYGTKSAEEIQSRVLFLADWMKQRGARALVLACNTASLFADIVRAHTGLPVFDAITPTVHSVLCLKAQRVVLLATNLTVACGIYQQAFLQNGVEVLAIPASPLVEAVENALPAREREQIVFNCLKDFPIWPTDVVVLGCTHFPFLQREISQFCNGATIVSCSECLANRFCAKDMPTGDPVFYTTGNEILVTVAVQQFADVWFTHIGGMLE